MGIPDHLTYLLRNLYAAQEATVRTGHGTTDWLQIEKYIKPVCCHLGHLTYMQSTSGKKNSELDETQAEIKTDRENINNIKYADGTTLDKESEEKL